MRRKIESEELHAKIDEKIFTHSASQLQHEKLGVSEIVENKFMNVKAFSPIMDYVFSAKCGIISMHKILQNFSKKEAGAKGVHKNHPNKLTVTLKFALALSVVVCLVIGLGILRFHAARLAYYLESINQSIQKYSDEEVVLRQELSALVAPIRIYSYCKESLGMQKVTKAETLPIRMRNENLAASQKNSPSQRQGWRSSLAWLLGR